MATMADAMASSVSRPLRLRVRPDLTARRHRYHGVDYWVVKEPVGLNYFRFHDEEFAILQMLDGRTSLEQIKERFEREFAPQKITYADLQHFVGMLHRSGLVVSETAGQGRQLKRRRDEKKRKEWLQWLSNIFALRWRGVDPERFLNRLYPYAGWFFSRATVLLAAALGAAALLLIAVHFDVFRSRLPTFHQFFGPGNWLWLGASLAVIKVLHELGHGLSCKRFGGECHEIGFMLLVFTPCLYCNVSDSWMLPNKWHRAAIGAAGMYVEGVIAAIATFLWWFSEPGLLNHLCLNAMFVCSVSTLLFNGNPLLRFDGYYILMDITEIPNLRQKSTELLRRFLVQLCLGIEQPENPFLPERRRVFFCLYTVAAVIYRWLIVFSIVMFLIKVLEPYGLKIIGELVAAAGFFGLVFQPLYQLGRFFYIPGRMHKMKKHRVAATLAVAAAVVLAVLYVPLPYHVSCSLELEPADATLVYPETPGRLAEVMAAPGRRVEPGTPLAQIENLDLELAVARLEGQVAQTATYLDTLQRRRVLGDPSIPAQLPQYEKVLQARREQLAEKQRQLQRLLVRAPAAGVVFPPPRRPPPKETADRLPQWSGTPLEPKNLGAYVQETDMLCQIGDPSRMVAVLVIDQSQIDLVAIGDEVDIMLDALPGRTLTTRVAEIAGAEMQAPPPEMTRQAGGDVATRTDAAGRPRPLSTSYAARTEPLVDPQGELRMAMRGKAKIYTGWRPLGSRISRFLARTFHFEL